MTQIPAGWYDDPNGGQRRYWNGTAWADPPPAPPSPKPGRVMINTILLVALLGGCTAWMMNSESDDVEPARSYETGLSLSEAWCNDLEAGLSPMAIMMGQIDNGRYTPEEAADRAYGFTSIECPEQLQSNQLLRTYLQGWGINPDA